MSGDAAGFLARIREVPHDDGPRLVYADWLDDQGDPRGEFVRVQVALARLPVQDRRRPDLLRAERDLLSRHGEAWAGPFRGLASGPVFRRGFVDEVNVAARQFLAHGDALFAAGPITHLHLLDVGSHLGPALQSPHLAKLTALTIYGQHVDERLARAVADCSHLAGLEVLHLGRNRIGDAGAELLAGSAHLANLRSLDLSENDLGEAAARALAGCPRLGRLARLELGGNAVGPVGAVAVATSPHLPALDRLGLAGNRVRGPRLVRADRPSALLRVGTLDLAGNELAPAGLGAILGSLTSAGVRDLDLGGNALGDEGAALLAGHPAAAGLRALRLTANGITDAGVAAVARSPHLFRLGSLDLAGNPFGDDGARALLDSPGLPYVRRLAFPQFGIAYRLRLELAMRYNRDAGPGRVPGPNSRDAPGAGRAIPFDGRPGRGTEAGVFTTLTRAAAPDPRTDAGLLAAFLADRDEAAFAEVVRRHGPLVLGVCRRALGPDPDADDAFQATFLVLVRQARARTWRPALGPWLYGVAVRVARRARCRRARRLAIETPVHPMPDPAAPAAAGPESADLLQALDAELAALPETYRLPLVLCDLQGLSRQRAARELGIAEGTLSSRLARGRNRLGDRLARRGFGPAVAAALAAVEVPARLQAATVGLAKAVAGGAAAGAVPAGVWALTEEAGAMTLSLKLKLAAGLTAVAVALTAVAATRGQDPKPGPAPAAGPPRPAAGAAAVATIFGDQKLTREQFGEYLIRKYGALEVDEFVTQQVLSRACAEKGVTVAAEEVDRSSPGFPEWAYRDAQLRKLTAVELRERGAAAPAVTGDELRRRFADKFGEKRDIRVIEWPKGSDRANVDRVRNHLAAAKGLEPGWAICSTGGVDGAKVFEYGATVSARPVAGDPRGARRAAAFALAKPGDVSPVVESDDGSLAVIQLVAVTPADAGRVFEAERAGLVAEAVRDKLRPEVERYRRELDQRARPRLHLTPAR